MNSERGFPLADEIKDGKVDVTRYMVKEGEKVNLKKYSTKCDVSIDKSQVKNLYFPQVIEKLKDLQEKLYAQNTYGLVVVLQAMDAAGKDGTINHVFASLNPGGVKVVSFKQPTTEEKTTITCGVSIRRCRNAGISGFSTVRSMRMSS